MSSCRTWSRWPPGDLTAANFRSLEASKFLLSETDPNRLGPCAAEVTFVGRSNVGKSTLLNALCGCKHLAHVSSRPGRTRTINVFDAGKDRWLVDLPGYGFATGPKWERDGREAMITGYLTGRASLRMVFALIDAEVGPTELDLRMVEWLKANRLPWRAVATKSDRVKKSRAAARRLEAAGALDLKPEELAWVCAKEGYGLGELRNAVLILLNS